MTSFTGYAPNITGSIDSPNLVGIEIARIGTSQAASGLFVFDLELGVLPLPPDFFGSLEVVGQVKLFTKDASYDATSQTWVWIGTAFNFIAGNAYKLVFRR